MTKLLSPFTQLFVAKTLQRGKINLILSSMSISKEYKILKQELIWMKENLNEEDCFLCNLALKEGMVKAYHFIKVNKPSVEKNIFPEYTKSEYWFEGGHSWWKPFDTKEVLDIKRQFLQDLIDKIDNLKVRGYATTRIYH